MDEDEERCAEVDDCQRNHVPLHPVHQAFDFVVVVVVQCAAHFEVAHDEHHGIVGGHGAIDKARNIFCIAQFNRTFRQWLVVGDDGDDEQCKRDDPREQSRQPHFPVHPIPVLEAKDRQAQQPRCGYEKQEVDEDAHRNAEVAELEQVLQDEVRGDESSAASHEPARTAEQGVACDLAG